MRHSGFITIHCLILRQAFRVWVLVSDSETHCLRAEMSGLNTSLYVRPWDNWHPKATPLKLVTRLQVVCDPTNTLHNHTVCTSARNALFIRLEQRNNFGYTWFDDTLSGCASGCEFTMRLVVVPEFDVENLVPTVYHLNYECNLTIYDIECEDNLP